MRHQFIEQGLAARRVGGRFEFLAETEFDRAFESHRAHFGGWPGDGEKGLMGTATAHRLRAETIALAQHDAE